MKTATPDPAKPALRLLKTGTCPSLSGKTKLTYRIACNDKSEIQMCISHNSGPGYFSEEWVPLSAILQILDKYPGNKPFTSYPLHALYRGKSINTPYFLLAALKQEGLVRLSTVKRRCYERTDARAYTTGIKALIEAPANPKAEGKQRKAQDRPATPGNRKAAARAKGAKKA